MKYNEFSRMEWKVLTSFLSSEKAMTTKELSEAFDLNQQSVLKIVRKLLEFEIIEVSGYVLSGKKLARSFLPKFTVFDLLSKELNSLTINNLVYIYLNRINDTENCNYLLNLVQIKKEYLLLDDTSPKII